MNKIKAKVVGPGILGSLLAQIGNNLKPMEVNNAVFYIDRLIYNTLPFDIRFIDFLNKPEMNLLLEPIPARSLGEYIEVYSKNDVEIEIHSDEYISEDDQKFYKSFFLKINVLVSFDIPKDNSGRIRNINDIINAAIKEYARIMEISLSNLDLNNTSMEDIINILNNKANDIQIILSYRDLIKNLPCDTESGSRVESYKRKVFERLDMIRMRNVNDIKIPELKELMNDIENKME